MGVAIFLGGANLAMAATSTQLITGIGGDSGGKVSDIGRYILNIYKWGIGLAALAALAFLVFGSIEKILSAGNIASAERANERMSAAIYGLILLLAAVTILYTINSKITDISTPNIDKIIAGPTNEEVQTADQAEYERILTEVKNSHPRLSESEQQNLAIITKNLNENISNVILPSIASNGTVYPVGLKNELLELMTGNEKPLAERMRLLAAAEERIQTEPAYQVADIYNRLPSRSAFRGALYEAKQALSETDFTVIYNTLNYTHGVTKRYN